MTPLVDVTQADMEAADEFDLQWAADFDAEALAALAQAFARHRIAAEQAKGAQIAELREALKAVREAISDQDEGYIKFAQTAWSEAANEMLEGAAALATPAPDGLVDDDLNDFITEARLHANDMPPVIQRDYLHSALDKLAALSATPASDGLREGEKVLVHPAWAEGHTFDATFIQYVEGWPEVRFRHDNSTCICRPSSVSRGEP